MNAKSFLLCLFTLAAVFAPLVKSDEPVVVNCTPQDVVETTKTPVTFVLDTSNVPKNKGIVVYPSFFPFSYTVSLHNATDDDARPDVKSSYMAWKVNSLYIPPEYCAQNKVYLNKMYSSYFTSKVSFTLVDAVNATVTPSDSMGSFSASGWLTKGKTDVYYLRNPKPLLYQDIKVRVSGDAIVCVVSRNHSKQCTSWGYTGLIGYPKPATFDISGAVTITVTAVGFYRNAEPTYTLTAKLWNSRKPELDEKYSLAPNSPYSGPFGEIWFNAKDFNNYQYVNVTLGYNGVGNERIFAGINRPASFFNYTGRKVLSADATTTTTLSIPYSFFSRADIVWLEVPNKYQFWVYAVSMTTGPLRVSTVAAGKRTSGDIKRRIIQLLTKYQN